MEFLTSVEAQRLYAEMNHEYPIRRDVEWSETVKEWGFFKPDSISLSAIAGHEAASSKLVDEVDFNN